MGFMDKMKELADEGERKSAERKQDRASLTAQRDHERAVEKAQREAQEAAKAERLAAYETAAAVRRFEYDVVELREKLLDGYGSAPTDKLRNLLNARAGSGWQLKTLVSAEVAGIVGKRDGWMVILERAVPEGFADVEV